MIRMVIVNAYFRSHNCIMLGVEMYCYSCRRGPSVMARQVLSLDY